MNQSIAKWTRSTLALFALSAAAAGCVAEAAILPTPIGPSSGTLTQRWSIGGSFDPNVCAIYGADRMELVVTDTAGNVVARAYQPCTEMEMTLTLPEGSYVGDAVLIAADNRDVSTTLPLQPFRVLAGTDTFIDTDFPTSSMYTVLASPEPAANAEIDASAE
jgi:hypothetical protein